MQARVHPPLACVLLLIAPLTLGAQSGRAASIPADFSAFLDVVDAAQVELQNGRPAAYKALWSRRDDITLSGGFGGTIESMCGTACPEQRATPRATTA